MADPASALRKMSPRVVSLFSGAGGMDLGFLRAGFVLAWANDASGDAFATYHRNLGDHVSCQDVRVVDPGRLSPCEVVIGGPPREGGVTCRVGTAWPGRCCSPPGRAAAGNRDMSVRSDVPRPSMPSSAS